ncbi:unnamed protein product [Cuscuta epithymum]|uniref:F-box domain-containing protein n=1 Tax=Cuscuta epithymum TaxID=186058 RepID=A0AAV0FXM1_9ASTE|nr:unnamed protein product [Cuscuta epithymum]
MSDDIEQEFGEEGLDRGDRVSGDEEQFGEEDMEGAGEEEIAEAGEQFGDEEEMEEAREEEEIEGTGEEEEIEVTGEEVGEDEELIEEDEARELDEEVDEGETEDGKEKKSLSRPKKRLKVATVQPVDRISKLPIYLLIGIISRLDTKDAVITSVLSKRWKLLWLFSPELKFRESSEEIETISKFVSWVNRLLVIYNSDFLWNFEMEFTYYECFASDVYAWLANAIKSEVMQLSLLLNSSPSKDLYKMPQLLFCNPSFERLRFKRCIMAPRRNIDWKSLTRLLLEEMELPQHVIDKLLSGCPLLTNLLLLSCWGFNRLEVKTQKLDVLGIGDAKDGVSDPLLEISAPLTECLLLTSYPRGRKWSVTNIPSVVKANIDFAGSDWDASSVEVMGNMKDLLADLQHVEELELRSDCIKVFSMLAMNGWEVPKSKRGSLIVNTTCNEQIISGILFILESSPSIEKLVVTGYRPDEEAVTLCPGAKCDLDCDLLHLKYVHITIWPDPNLAGEPMMTLAQVLLKRATVLEKMVIDVEYTTHFVEVIQTLLGYPRSSPNAVIELR